MYEKHHDGVKIFKHTVLAYRPSPAAEPGFLAIKNHPKNSSRELNGGCFVLSLHSFCHNCSVCSLILSGSVR
jgi:hypothetical protein